MTRLRLAPIVLIVLSLALPLPTFAQTPDKRKAEAMELRDLAFELMEEGDYDTAYAVADKAYERVEKAFGFKHPVTAGTLAVQATILQRKGDWAAAERFSSTALAIMEEAVGSEDPALTAYLNNLANTYTNTGDYPRAEALYLRALAIDEKAKGPDHTDVALSLRNLAGLYKTMGGEENFHRAASSLQRALSIMKKAWGPDHVEVGRTLHHYGELARFVAANLDVGAEKNQALNQVGSILLQALQIKEKALGREHVGLVDTLESLAAVYRDTGNYEPAGLLLQRAVTIQQKIFGPSYANSDTLIQLAVLQTKQKNYRAALDSCKRALSIEDRQIQNFLVLSTEEQKLKFMENASANYLACLSLIHQHRRNDPRAVREALTMVLRRKGLILDSQSRAHQALQGRLSAESKQAWAQLAALRTQLAGLTLNMPGEERLVAHLAKVRSVEEHIESLEKQLALESMPLAQKLAQRTMTVEAAAKALPRRAALVEWVKIGDFNFEKVTWAPTSRYLAFVLTSHGAVTLADLGETGEVETQAQQALEHIATSMKSPQRSDQSLKALHQAVWAPIQDALKDIDKVVLSPDGQLNLVPFSALLDSKGRPLIERYRLAYVSSGREIIVSTGAAIKSESELLLVANPAFDKLVAASSTTPAVRSRSFRGAFGPLPGTAQEAQSIPALVSGPAERKQVLLDSGATESAVKAARSPRILHLATHGFFLEDEVMPLEQDKKRAAPKIENPLVRSGLAFAGANHAAESASGDDGILTALEITAMDLYGTDLVVLSACETGVGEVKNGEGVYGLRRAFALAGAKNLMMSLWPVNDAVTATQMQAFYKNMQTMPPAEALRQAQIETIKELKAKFGGTAPPVLWAPFFLQGAQGLGQ